MNKYRMNYCCSNCFYVVTVWIPKGEEAPVFFECPRCWLDELRKTDRELGICFSVYVMINEGKIEPKVF